MDGQRLEFKFRVGFAISVMGLAWFLNIALIAIIVMAFVRIQPGSSGADAGPYASLLTERVLLALIAATAAQVGTAFVLVTRYLFPGRPERTRSGARGRRKSSGSAGGA